MSVENSSEQKRIPQTPADKTDAPRHAQKDSVSLLETDDYVCIQPFTPLSEAIERMKEDEGGCAIICEDDRVVGIFTERDLLTKVIGEQVDMNAPVSNWMSPIVKILTTDATLGDVVRAMNEKSYRNIPLVKDDRLVGPLF